MTYTQSEETQTMVKMVHFLTREKDRGLSGSESPFVQVTRKGEEEEVWSSGSWTATVVVERLSRERFIVVAVKIGGRRVM